MEPLLLVCPGCAVRIRAADPVRARSRTCPRCATPLGSAVEAALRVAPEPSTTRSRQPAIAPFAIEPPRGDNPFPTTDQPSKRWSRWAIVGLGLVAASTLFHWGILPGDSLNGGAADSEPNRRQVTAPPAIAWSQNTWRSTPSASARAPLNDFEDSADQGNEPATEPPVAPAVEVSESPAKFAIQDAESPVSSKIPAPVIPPNPLANSQPQPPGPPPLPRSGSVDEADKVPASPTPVTPSQPRRLLVRDSKGAAVVAREHGTIKDQMAVILPDGTIGWPTTQVFTDAPFVPSTVDDLERTLHDGEFSTFRVVKTEHYLVFYQSSERFARASADLLEELYGTLFKALKKQNLPVTPTEFPLVAVIFQSEDDFRSNRKVAPEVQAYYEILSNRIFFFEKSKKQSASPEVSALRKPQTVAHEGTHQVLHNVGIQPRMSPWPLWLVEGLAEYCSPPQTTKKGVAWAGLAKINPIHLTTIRDLEDPMSSEVRGGPKAPSARDRGQPLVEYLATRSELTPTDYALSWGLTHYLAQNRVDQFVAYIRKLNRLRPFEERTPEEQLADFREAFGKDLTKLDAQVAKYLGKLRVPDAQALPFYAVLLEQQVSPTSIRRMAMVSQSPSVIRQWVETASHSAAGPIQWEPVPHPNRTRAMVTADAWLHQGR